MRLLLLTVLAMCVLVACAAPGGGATHRGPAAAAPKPRKTRVLLGRSVRGRPITATVLAAPGATRSVLVVGCVHGDEPAGGAITRRLRGARAPAGVALWLVDTFNPDGRAADRRQNARGVDLNRNAPWRWRPLGAPGSTFYSGRGPLSEPETRAIVRLVRRIRPAVSIWYHQHARLVDDSGGDRRVERRYARRVGLRFGRLGPYPGSITSWQNATHPGTTAFVVELPPGRLARRALALHEAAVLAAARESAPDAARARP